LLTQGWRRQPLQPHPCLWQRPPGHQGGRSSVRDKVLTDGGGPALHENCTEEIPVTVNGTDAFVDPIRYVIKSAGSPIHCNDVAPPRYKVGGKWYCSYPELKECHDPEMLPVDGEDRPHAGQRHRLGQKHLHPRATGRVRQVPGQPGNQEGVPGGDGGPTWAATRKENGA
jgi:hypothetical protein